MDNLKDEKPAEKKLEEKLKETPKGGDGHDRKDPETGTFDTTLKPPAGMTATPKTGVAETKNKRKKGEAQKNTTVERFIKKPPPKKPPGGKRSAPNNASMGSPLPLPSRLKAKGTTHKHDTDSTEDL